ncbi:MAG: T9SS type A sorting domain-containing protein [Bacteroidota bacterium]
MNLRTTCFQLLFALIILGCSTPALFGQQPQTIIIVTDNGHGTGEDIEDLAYPAQAFDPAETELPCQAIERSGTLRNLNVIVNDIIYYTPDPAISSLNYVRLQVSINDPLLVSPYSAEHVYRITDLTVSSSGHIEIPLQLVVEIQPFYMAEFDLAINLEISTLNNGISPAPDGSNFEFRSVGPYLTKLCLRSLKNSIGFREGIEVENEMELLAYPNPVTDYLSLQIPAEGDQRPEILLLDLNGKTQSISPRTKYSGNNSWISSVPTAQLSRGIYMLLVRTSEKTFSQKLIKE